MPHIYYLPNEREFEASQDETILQVSLRSGIPHTHVWGRYARCSTCRVSILEGLEQPYLEALYKRSWHIRIGVHYGAAVVGAIGVPDKKRVTANGDYALRSYRLEGTTDQRLFRRPYAAL